VVAIAAACAEGTTIINDAKELRVKESDRIATTACELQKCGVTVQEQPDGMIITGTEHLAGASCKSHGDHRIAMALAVAGLVAQSPISIEDCDCINTSFPEFMTKLTELAG